MCTGTPSSTGGAITPGTNVDIRAANTMKNTFATSPNRTGSAVGMNDCRRAGLGRRHEAEPLKLFYQDGPRTTIDNYRLLRSENRLCGGSSRDKSRRTIVDHCGQTMASITSRGPCW